MFVFAAGCDCSDSDDNDNGGFVDLDDPNLVTSFLTGSGSVTLDVPDDGCIGQDAMVETTAGIRLLLAAGTCLSQRATGEFIRGPIVIHVDAGDPDVEWLEGGDPLGGSVRVWASLPNSMTPVDIAFEPPARLELGDVLGEYSGTWVLESYAVSIDDGQLAQTPPGEPPSGISYEAYNFTRGVGRDGEVLIPVSTLTGARLDDRTLPPPGFECAGDVVHTQVLGPVGSDYPRVCTVMLGSPAGGQVLAVGAWFPGLGVPGQSRVIGPGRDIEVRIVERDGNRVLEICSPYKNELYVRTTCCVAPDSLERTKKETFTDDSGGEEDLDGPYDGAIEIRLLTWGGFGEHIKARRRIRDARANPLQTTTDRTYSLGYGGCIFSKMRTFGHSLSVRRYAELLPQEWQFKFGEREITITVPCPPPVTVGRAAGENVVHVIDPVDLEVDLTSAPLPGNADKVIVLPGDIAIVATAEIADLVSIPGALHRVDLVTGSVLQTVTFPGLSTGIVEHPHGDRLFMATADGVLRTLDPATLTETSRIEGLPPGRYDKLAVSPDGGAVFAVAPVLRGPEVPDLQGQPPGLLKIELLNGIVASVPGTEGMIIHSLDVSVNSVLGLLAETPQIEVILLGNGINVRAAAPSITGTISFTSGGERVLLGSADGIIDRNLDLQDPITIENTDGTTSFLLFTLDDVLNVFGVRDTNPNFYRAQRNGPVYTNELGTAAPAIIDTQAFARNP